jgi:hypothetical protein
MRYQGHGGGGECANVDDSMEACLGAALRFLLKAQDPDGWWKDFWLPDGASDEWVTAFVGAHLAGLPHPRAKAAAGDAWGAMAKRRGYSDGWGYNAATPADADSTLWGLRLAQALGTEASGRVRGARQVLIQHLGPGGGTATYAARAEVRRFLGGSDQMSVQGWCGMHTCVTAAAAHVDILGPRLVGFLRRSQERDGHWRGYWWCDDEYTTCLAAEALAKLKTGEDGVRVDRAIGWAEKRMSAKGAVCSDAHGGPSAFATAWCLRILALADGRDRMRVSVRRAKNWLLENQKADGSWAAAAWLRVPPPHMTQSDLINDKAMVVVDDRRVFTTATVLAALCRGERQRESWTYELGAGSAQSPHRPVDL